MREFERGSVRAAAWVAAVALLVASEAVAQAKVAYVRSQVGAPWGSNTNEQAMDLAFGPGQWDDLRFEQVDPNTLFSPTYSFLYLEGSDNNANELYSFLQANQAKLEAWVAAGGSLFLNAAPNEGGSQNWGFGGVTLHYSDSSVNPGSAIDPNHPIWLGPHLPIATSFTGSSFAHATVSGPGLIGLIKDANGGNPHLAERPKDNGGCVIFGGLTTSNFWTPPQESLRLRANIIEYLAACASIGDTDKDGVVDEVDNCVDDANPGQEDEDGDGLGDVCDACPADADNDADSDGVCGDVDNCPAAANGGQEDGDNDGQGDACDACPADADNDADGDGVCGDVDNCPAEANGGQEDGDNDGQGDACDTCPADADNDADGDGVCGDVDNCPADANPGQEDMDGNGVGDACDMAGTTTEMGTDSDGTTTDAGTDTDGTTTDVGTDTDVGTTTDAGTDTDSGTTGVTTDDPTTGTSTSGPSTASDSGAGSSGDEPTTGGGGTSGVGTTTTDSSSTGDSAGGTGGVDDGGCACTSTPSGPANWLASLAAVLLLRRRRRAA